MGYICEMKCKHCGYTFETFIGFGRGLLREQEMAEQRAREGKYGEIMQEFFKVYPLGTIDTNLTVAVCPVCQEFKSVEDLTMYVPKKKGKDFWQIADEKYAENFAKMHIKMKAPRDFSYYDHTFHASVELEAFYDKYMEYEHHCPDCGSIMRMIPYFDDYVADDKHVIQCPKCGNVVKVENVGFWD